MSRLYKPVSERAKTLYGKDEFEADYTPSEERDQVASGHVEIVPSSYKVLSDNYTGGEQGEVIELALPLEVEAALVAGEHIKPVSGEKPKKAAAKKAAKRS
jgi:hypothetical protein